MGTPKASAREMSASSNFTDDELAKLLAMLEKHDVFEFQLERGGDKLSLKRGAAQQVNYVVHSPAPAASMPVAGSASIQNVASFPQGPLKIPDAPQPTGTSAGGAPSIQTNRKVHELKSPMVGSFYRRPAVDADPYVEVGDVVKKGDVLCIVEAMKIMNEIEADVSGKVVEVCIEDASMVEYGEVLFRIEQN